MQPSKDQVAVLDDHSLIIDGIHSLLLKSPGYNFAGGFTSSIQFNDFLSTHPPPEFLLLDINLSGEDGMTLCKLYTKTYPHMKIIMLTGLSEPAIIKNAIKSGCAGFMLKNMKAEELWECLATIKQGERYLHPDVERILLQHAVDKRATDNTDYIPRLSRREKEVLVLIVQERTTQEIAKMLFISVNTVETHRASLLTKFGVRNIAGLVRVAIEKGLI